MYELHGSIQTAACPACGARYDLPHLLEREVPECTAAGNNGDICGTVLKTDVVLFGDAVMHFDTLYEKLDQADLLLVIGTSLEVAPARFVPEDASLIPGMKKVIINLEPTYCDSLFDMVIHHYMLKGKTIYVRPLEVTDAEENLGLQSENRDFFEQFSMIRADDYYTVEGQRKRITEYQERLEKDEEYHFGIFTASDDRLIGTVSLFQIIRGALQTAFIGYF